MGQGEDLEMLYDGLLPPRQQWEYATDWATDSRDSVMLKTRGDDGWELVGVIPYHMNTRFYFKRPRRT